MDAWRMREGISGSGRTMSKIPKISVTVVLTQFTDTGQKKKKKTTKLDIFKRLLNFYQKQKDLYYL